MYKRCLNIFWCTCKIIKSQLFFQDQYEYTHMVLKTLCEEWLADFADHDYENIVIGDKEEQTEKVILSNS